MEAAGSLGRRNARAGELGQHNTIDVYSKTPVTQPQLQYARPTLAVRDELSYRAYTNKGIVSNLVE